MESIFDQFFMSFNMRMKVMNFYLFPKVICIMTPKQYEYRSSQIIENIEERVLRD
jgi:predicted protein tyrosine phosphatase